jgi:ethylmalonyl-CoA/methylmalonyl-CoA decarboxylase
MAARSSLSGAALQHLLAKLRPLGGGAVHLERRGAQAVLTLSNPSARNALSGKMMCELHDAVNELERAPGAQTQLLVAGSSEYFCSGADLRVLSHFSREEGLQMSALMQDTLSRMRALPLVSCALLSGGGAMGGGTELALSCDLRVMEDKAQFQMVQTKLGLSPGWGGGSRLVGLVGRRAAIKVLCTAQRLSAHDCLELGLADAVGHEGQSASEVAQRLLEPIGSAAYPHSVQQCKRLIAFADDAPGMAQSLEFEEGIFASVWQGAENLDALAKLKNKARPAAASGGPAAGKTAVPGAPAIVTGSR